MYLPFLYRNGKYYKKDNMRVIKLSALGFVFFVLSLVTLISCGENRNVENVGKIVKFTLQKDIDSLPIDAKYIPLETPEGCLIGSVDQLAMTDDAIFILESDQEHGGMYVFDKDGRFVTRIGNRGRGPGEYILPMSFTINSELIGILDGGMNKLLYYDIHTFEFVRQRPIFNSTYFEWLDDKTMVWGNDESNPEIPYSEFSYVVTDTSLDVNVGYLDKVIRSGYSIMTGKPVYRFKDEVRMYASFIPTVYRGTAENCTPVYTIDFDRFELPPAKYMEKISRNNQCYFDELENSGYVSSYGFFETTGALCVRYMVKHEKYIGLYSKANGQGFAYKKDDFERKISHKYSYISGVIGDYFVAPLFIPLLRENPDDVKLLPPDLKRIVDVSSDGDNPILFLFKPGV